MSDKLNISNEMRQFDKKNRDFYDELIDDERKKFSTFLMLRWGSAVEGSRELQEFYLIATNERLNKNFFAMGKHPKLQWLCATTVSPDMGTPRHNWIAPKKKEPGASSIRRQLAEIYPDMKNDDIAVLASITSKKQIDEHYKLMGQETKK
jgi:hypothetical protein